MERNEIGQKDVRFITLNESGEICLHEARCNDHHDLRARTRDRQSQTLRKYNVQGHRTKSLLFRAVRLERPAKDIAPDMENHCQRTAGMHRGIERKPQVAPPVNASK